MLELMVTNDSVLLSYVEALLSSQGIETVVFDRHISLLEGSIGAFPRRLLVAGENWTQAKRLMIEAGLGQWVADRDEH